MMKYIILLSFLFLTSCSGIKSSLPSVIETKHDVIMPSVEFFNCPVLESFPDANSLTDLQVSQTIVKLYNNNVTCKASMNALHDFLEKSKKDVEEVYKKDS